MAGRLVKQYISWARVQPEPHNVIRNHLGHHWQKFQKFKIQQGQRSTFLFTVNDTEALIEFVDFCLRVSSSDKEYIKIVLKRS